MDIRAIAFLFFFYIFSILKLAKAYFTKYLELNMIGLLLLFL